MREGHPFETEALDKLRVKQRGLLRRIPGWIVERLQLERFPHPEPIRDGDEVFAETLVRELIEDKLQEDPEVRSLVEQNLARDGQAAALFMIYRSSFTQSVLLDNDDVGKVYHELEEAMTEAKVSKVDPQLLARIHLLIVLLVLADRLATDDYVDPRVPPLQEA